MLRQSLTGICLLGASYAEVDASWLQNAAIFIAATGAAVFYWRSVFKPNQYAEKRIETRLEKLEAEMRRKFDELNANGEARAKAYHDRVNPLEAKVSALETSDEIQHQQICTLETRLNIHIEKARK